jgi:hypothetical protein
MRKNLLGLVLGLILGNVAVMGAQALTFHPDPLNKVCWTQAVDATVPNVAAANAMRTRVTYNQNPAIDVGHTCTGVGPFTCTVTDPVPMALQVVGSPLTVVVFGATVDPADGSVGPYSNLVSATINFSSVPAPPTPGSGSNLRLVKTIAAAIAAVAVAIYHFFV